PDLQFEPRRNSAWVALARLSTRAANARNRRQRMARTTRLAEDGVQYTRNPHTVVSCRVTERSTVQQQYSVAMGISSSRDPMADLMIKTIYVTWSCIRRLSAPA